MTTPLAAIDSGWVIGFATLASAAAALAGVWFQQERQKRQERRAYADAPAKEMVAAGEAANVIVRAATALVTPLQTTITSLQADVGRLHEEVEVSRLAEARCQVDLDLVRGELRHTQGKLREVTDRLGIPPNGPD